jgi:hypothetical protein
VLRVQRRHADELGEPAGLDVRRLELPAHAFLALAAVVAREAGNVVGDDDALPRDEGRAGAGLLDLAAKLVA